MNNNKQHGGCALCDIKETGHGMIVYPDIRWISAINKQDGNYYIVFCHEGDTAKMQIAYCPVCGKKLEERDGEMKVIDCNKCTNCDKEHDRCKLYGSDPKKAVEMCASKNFGGYRPNGAKMDAEATP